MPNKTTARKKLPSSKPRPEQKKLLFAFATGAAVGIAATIFSFVLLPLKNEVSVDPKATAVVLETSEISLPEFPKVFIAEEPLPEDAVSDTEEAKADLDSGVLPAYPVVKITKPVVTKAKSLWPDFAVKVAKLPKDAPKIAIIIDDLGIDKKRTAKIIALPAPITASFITYAGGLPKQITKAKENGKEIMLHIPMEARSGVDTGPDALTTAMSAEEIAAALKKNLSPELLAQGVVGVNNHMGSKFTKNPESVRAFMKAYAPYQRLFIDSRTAPGSSAVSIADSLGVAAAGRNVFIDNKDDVSYILGQLHILEKSARRNGMAIGIGHPHDGTIKALAEWLPTLAEKGIYLVPVSYIVKERLAAKNVAAKQ